MFFACLEVDIFSISLFVIKYRAATAPTNTDYELTRKIVFIVSRIDLLRYCAKKFWRTNFELNTRLCRRFRGRNCSVFHFVSSNIEGLQPQPIQIMN